MNCFDFQNRTSDYLDGALIGPLKREADEHLEDCRKCSTRYKHYRLILTSLSGQPRSALPVAIRKAPFSAPIAGVRKAPLRERLRLWSDLAWYIRVPIEGATIVLLVSLAVSAGPRLRSFYEKKVEKSLTEYNEGFGGDEAAVPAGAQLARGNLSGETLAPPEAEGTSANDDFSSGEAESAGDAGDTGDAEVSTPIVKNGSSETWRFNLKTDSPHDIRTKIVQILTDLKLPASTPGLGGIEAPGGIQFDLIVPQSIIPDLKQALEKIAPAPPKELADSPFGETFTWYKKKSKNPLPMGQTHVVIWLAQI